MGLLRYASVRLRIRPDPIRRLRGSKDRSCNPESWTFRSTRESSSPRSSLDVVCRGKAGFFGPWQTRQTGHCQFSSMICRVARANQRHWESHKLGCAIHRRGSTALPLRTRHAGKRPCASIHFSKAVRQCVFSTSHFAMPTTPASPPDARCRADLSADAIGAKRRSNISTNRAQTRCRDQRQAKPAGVALSNPMCGTAVEMFEQKEAPIRANRRRSKRRRYQIR
jgi:hypothetical protein